MFLSLWRSPEQFPPSDGSLRMPLLVRAHARVVELVAEGGRCDGPAEGSDALGGPTLSQLTAAERIAITLTYFGGLSYGQVAALVQRPKHLVAEDLRTGLSRLAWA